MNIYPHLRSHQSMLLVYPTRISAREAFIKTELPPDLKDVDFLYPKLSLVRTNPNSRIPTAVVFTSYTTDPYVYQGMQAPVELIDIYAFKDRSLREKWQTFQKIQERFNHAITHPGSASSADTRA